jgi:hypothetical protein
MRQLHFLYYEPVDTVDIDFNFKYLQYLDRYMYQCEVPKREKERESQKMCAGMLN